MSSVAITLRGGADLDGFRRAVRSLMTGQIPPHAVTWQTADQPSLFAADTAGDGAPVSLPRDVSELIRTVVCHRAPERFALLYELIWRVSHGGERNLHWDGTTLRHGPPGKSSDVPAADAFEAGWGDYYASTFNPARTNTAMMQKEMPKKYWRNMPETKLIPEMLRQASSRVEEMLNSNPQAPRKTMPGRTLATMLDNEVRSLEDLNASIMTSEPFVKGGTRAVLGEGPTHPSLMLVGEQPGDQEDLQGRPFVGPAGQLLDQALKAAGIDRGRTYLTNAVKHFKYEERGKRRIHQKPTAGEVKRYRWWLEKEIELVSPRLIVALGATAVLALTGKSLPLLRSRGPATFENRSGFITLHPSYMLRLPDADERAETFATFVADLGQARELSEAA